MNKILKYMAAAIFIATLAINVKVTLDDPFVLLSDEAIATTTSSSSSSGTNNPGPYIEWYKNKTRFIYNISASVAAEISDDPSVNAEVEVNSSGAYTYCKSALFKKKCYLNLNGWVPFD